MHLIDKFWDMFDKILIWFHFHFLIYLFVTLGLISAMAWGIWRIIVRTRSVNRMEPFEVNTANLDIVQQRLNHVNQEITRYRDLSSGKTAYIALAVYAGICVASAQWGIQLPAGLVNALILLTAGVCCIFHFFCEERIIFNQEQRRTIENSMKLPRTIRHEPTSENPLRPNAVVSIIFIELFIWVPALMIIVFRGINV